MRRDGLLLKHYSAIPQQTALTQYALDRHHLRISIYTLVSMREGPKLSESASESR